MVRKRKTHKPKNNQRNYITWHSKATSYPTLIPGILDTLFNNIYDYFDNYNNMGNFKKIINEFWNKRKINSTGVSGISLNYLKNELNP